MSESRVSIVIPCYNYAHYVGQAIESALAQTLPPGQVIVVNDGSTDNTVQVVSQYPVTLINQANAGQSASCNRGVRESLGEFIVLLSADDLLHPRFLEHTLPLLDGRPDLSFVYTHGLTFGQDQSIIFSQASTVEHLRWGNTLIATFLMRKNVFQATGGYNTELRYAEDWDFVLRLVERGYKGELVPEALVFIRTHGTSLRHSTATTAADQSVQRIWRLHPGIFTPGFVLRWRMRRLFQNNLHRLIMWVRAHAPNSYERYRAHSPWRPRALDLERKRMTDLPASDKKTLIPPFVSDGSGPWEEVLRQWA
jgi:glycosyltransferase involved in cell wall biosynthesis